MSNEKLDKLSSLLDELLQIAPCNGGPCVGYMNCEFGENGCYGSSCAIEDVQNALYSVRCEK